MIRGETLTVVIPARKGSKGIPQKNMYPLGGIPLITRAIMMAKRNTFVDQVIVSTDCETMFEISREHDVSMGELRSPALAQDSSLTVDVVLDALARKHVTSGWVMLLQVSSPLRTSSDFDSFCRAWSACTDDAEAMTSVVRHMSPHPYKLQTFEQKYLRSFERRESMVPRQSLPPVYALNGAFYLTSERILNALRTFLPEKTIPYVMPPEKSLNLDTAWDIKVLQALVEANLVSIENLDC